MVTAEELREVVGADNVSDDPALLEACAGDHSFVPRMAPHYVVRVSRRESVPELVALARRTRTSLVPVSSGPPHFHGDTVPSSGDAIIVDLSGLKGIDLIDPQERVASAVEAGVTFGELIAATARDGLRLNMPLCPRSTKSVVGSLLSREPVIMPHYHWDICDPAGSMEVVFGTGDLFRTGAAAGPGDLAEQRVAGGRQKEAAGPSAMSLHRLLQGAQGTMGIVTWASVRCELAPTLEQPYFIGSEDLGKLLQAAHWLVRLRLGNELFLVDRAYFAALAAQDADQRAEVAAAAPQWLLFFNLGAYRYLPELRLQGQIEDTRELLQRLGLEALPSLAGVSAWDFLELVRTTSPEPYWKLRPRGGCQDVFFLTTYRHAPRLVEVMRRATAEAGHPPGDLGVYLQPVVQGTSYHMEFSLFFDPTDPAETAAVRGLATSVIRPLMAEGAFFSRPFGEAARFIMNQDAASVEALRKFKAVVDPAGILNPGKLCF